MNMVLSSSLLFTYQNFIKKLEWWDSSAFLDHLSLLWDFMNTKFDPWPAYMIQKSSSLKIIQVYQEFNQDITQENITSLEMKAGR